MKRLLSIALALLLISGMAGAVKINLNMLNTSQDWGGPLHGVTNGSGQDAATVSQTNAAIALGNSSLMAYVDANDTLLDAAISAVTIDVDANETRINSLEGNDTAINLTLAGKLDTDGENLLSGVLNKTSGVLGSDLVANGYNITGLNNITFDAVGQDINLSGRKLSGVVNGTLPQDVATFSQIVAGGNTDVTKLPLAGGVMDHEANITLDGGWINSASVPNGAQIYDPVNLNQLSGISSARATIYQDNDKQMIVAMDEKGHILNEDYYGWTEDNTALVQSAFTYAAFNGDFSKNGRGIVAFRSVQHINISSTIYTSPGVMISGGGTLFDVRYCNATVFQFGLPDYVYPWASYSSGYRITGIRDVSFWGSPTASNCTTVVPYNVHNDMQIKNIVAYGCNNIIKVVGCGYDTEIDHVEGSTSAGIGINLEYTPGGPCVGASSGTTITDCDLSACGTAIKIDSSVVQVRDTWIETSQYGIIINGTEVLVDGGYIHAYQNGIIINGDADWTTIKNINFDMVAGPDSGILLDMYTGDVLIGVDLSNNRFRSVSGEHCIKSSSLGTFSDSSICKNVASMGAGSKFVELNAPTYYVNMNDNLLTGVASPLTVIGFNVTTYGSALIINNNQFRWIGSWLSMPTVTNGLTNGNIFTGSTLAPNVGSGWLFDNSLKLTTTELAAIATPAIGSVAYNTTTAKLCVFTTNWVPVH